jgi:probable rRNA maturation factor
MVPSRFEIKLSLLNESSHKNLPLNINTIKRCLRETLKAAGMRPDKYEVSLYFIDDERMRLLNREHRGYDKTTDVLSFPQFDRRAEMAPGPEGYILLGDVTISLQTLYRRCLNRGDDPAREFAQYLIHSVLHLIGYNHEYKRERVTMEMIEQSVIDTLSL